MLEQPIHRTFAVDHKARATAWELNLERIEEGDLVYYVDDLSKRIDIERINFGNREKTPSFLRSRARKQVMLAFCFLPQMRKDKVIGLSYAGVHTVLKFFAEKFEENSGLSLLSNRLNTLDLCVEAGFLRVVEKTDGEQVFFPTEKYFTATGLIQK